MTICSECKHSIDLHTIEEYWDLWNENSVKEGGLITICLMKNCECETDAKYDSEIDIGE